MFLVSTGSHGIPQIIRLHFRVRMCLITHNWGCFWGVFLLVFISSALFRGPCGAPGRTKHFYWSLFLVTGGCEVTEMQSQLFQSSEAGVWMHLWRQDAAKGGRTESPLRAAANSLSPHARPETIWRRGGSGAPRRQGLESKTNNSDCSRFPHPRQKKDGTGKEAIQHSRTVPTVLWCREGNQTC